MIPLLLSEVAEAVNGQLVISTQGSDLTIDSVSTDSRSLVAGDVFIALKGPNFDGHNFVTQAKDILCSAVIVDHPGNDDITQIIVADTHEALGKLAAYVKQKVAPKTVAITGSSGKTTVKEMVAAILARLGNVLATKGNFNNDIGVPLTLLRLTHQHTHAVIELGANHMGEIAYTTELVKPDVAIINNIAAAHLEGFGDLSGVARAKGEIYSGLSENGVAIYNRDSKFAHKWQWRLEGKQVKVFSCDAAQENADCFSSDVVLDEDGCANFQLNTSKGNAFINLTVPGKHNVCNAVAAATIAIEFGATIDDIRLGLAEMCPVKGRLNIHNLANNTKLIDDTYNANVESIKAGTDLLASYPGRRILILGDMGELGAEARSYHQEVGLHAKQVGIDDLLTIGVLSQSTSDVFNENGHHFSERSALITQLQQLLEEEHQQISILVKGSRSSHMEHVVKDIIDWRNPQPASQENH